MAKTKISEFSSTPASNTDIDSIFIGEGMAPSNVNDAIRELMSQLKDWQSGTSNDPYVVGSSGSLTLNQGTANGVAYLNGSKVVTSGSALTFDGSIFGITGGTGIQAKIYNSGLTGTQASSIGIGKSEASGNTVFLGWANNSGSPFGYLGTYGGGSPLVLQPDGGNLGLGVTPSAWGGSYKALQNSAGFYGNYSTTNIIVGQNWYDSAAGSYKYVNNGYATYYTQVSGAHQWYNAPSGTAGNAITFTQAMTLDASGNLGLGTTSTSGIRFSVDSGSTGLMGNFNSTNANGGYLRFQNSGTSIADIGTAAQLFSGSASDFGINVRPSGSLVFATYNTERARIDSSGRLAVGGTVGYGTVAITSNSGNVGVISSAALWINVTSTSYKLAQFEVNSGGAVGTITTNGSTTSYNTSSDIRLKENIVDSDSASALIDALQVRQFDWKSDGSHQRYGFVAQELVSVAPEAVYQPADQEEMMGVDYSKLVPMLVKEIQSLRQRIATLEAK